MCRSFLVSSSVRDGGLIWSGEVMMIMHIAKHMDVLNAEQHRAMTVREGPQLYQPARIGALERYEKQT